MPTPDPDSDTPPYSHRVKTGYIRIALNGQYYEWVQWNPNALWYVDTISTHYGPALTNGYMIW